MDVVFCRNPVREETRREGFSDLSENALRTLHGSSQSSTESVSVHHLLYIVCVCTYGVNDMYVCKAGNLSYIRLYERCFLCILFQSSCPACLLPKLIHLSFSLYPSANLLQYHHVCSLRHFSNPLHLYYLLASS